jgi:membrane protein YdbS with pleckstrin-like domain
MFRRRKGGLQPLSSSADLTLADQKLDLSLKRVWAWTLLVALLVLLGSTEALFWFYLIENGWNVDASTINVWLGATVVQVVGLATIIVRYLFPRRDRRGDSP